MIPTMIIFMLMFVGIFQTTGICHAQILLHGRVTDCKTGEPLAFVNLTTADRAHGTSTDIEGRFSLEINRLPIQLSASYVGYETLHQWISSAGDILRLEMCPSVLLLSEVIIMPWDNPALAIIRKVSENRRNHDPARLESYRCQAYGKMVFTADTSQMADTKVVVPDTTMLKIRSFMKEQHFFLMETVSERDYTKGRLHEKVTGSRVAGFNDPMFVFLISQIQSFSFYDDLIRISDKSYLNPVSPAGLRKYFFSLEDTLYPGTDTVYVIRYQPLPGSRFDAMKGLLFIHTNGWAVQNVTAEPAVEQGGISISIRQRYALSGQHWFPAELGTTLLLKNVMIQNFFLKGEGSYYLRDIEINPAVKRGPKSRAELEVIPGAARRDSSFWIQHRSMPLDEKELRTYQFIDSIGEKHGFDLLGKRMDALSRGRFPIGAFEIDLRKLTRYNEYEKGYIGLGVWTGKTLLPGLQVGAWAGYGFHDKAWKYGAEIRADIYRPWDVEAFVSASDDLQEQGMVWSPQRPGQSWYTEYRKLYVSQMDRVIRQQAGFSWRPVTDVFCTISMERERLAYANPYQFAILQENVTVWPDHGVLRLATLEVRYARKERILQGFNSRLSYGSSYPVISLRLRQSLDIPAGGQSPIRSIEIQAEMRHTFPLAGISHLSLISGLASGGVPASYLFYGKSSYAPYSLHSPASFPTMRMNEFLSDRFVSLFYYHDFKHLLTGRKQFPSLQIHFNAAWGSLTQAWMHHGIQFQTMENIYLDGGFLLPDILTLGFAKLGAGAFWRLGHYRYPNTWENLSLKISLGFPN